MFSIKCPDRPMVERYIEAVAGLVTSEVTWVIGSAGDRPARTLDGPLFEVWTELTEANASGHEVSYRPKRFRKAPTMTPRAEGAFGPFLFVELLVRPAWFHQQPSLVITSPQGLQVYWLVDDCRLEELRDAQAQLEARYEAREWPPDHDLLLRVPGFCQNADKDQVVGLEYVCRELRYGLTELLAGLHAPAQLPDAESSRADIASEWPPAHTRSSGGRLRIDDPKIRWPVLTGQGKPSLKHVENLRALLAAYGMSVRYCLMRRQLEIDVPGFSVSQERQQNASEAKLIELAERHGLSEAMVRKQLDSVTEEYHPVADWIDSWPWDGSDRLEALLDTVHLRDVGDRPLARMLLRRWLVGCVCAVYKSANKFRDFKPQGVLTFQGRQGAGKTSWLRALAPQGSGWVAEGVTLNPTDRDSVQQATRFWITELGEVDATFKRADLATLKGFLTRDADTYRSAYARREEHTPRRTMFAATVNDPEFLRDPTGNRRFWVLRITKLDFNHKLNMQQVWAQLKALAFAGQETWFLSEQEQALLEASNAHHQVRGALADEISAHFDVLDPRSSIQDWLSVDQIRERLPSIKVGDHRDQQAVVSALRELGIDRGPTNGHTRTGNRWPLTLKSPLPSDEDWTSERSQASGD